MRLVELFALCGFALTQPVLDIFGRNPSQFIFRGAGTSDVWWFALVVTLVPALVLWAGESLVSLVRPLLGRWLHLVLVGALTAAFVLQAARPLVNRAPLLLLAAAAGVGVAHLRHRSRAARLWLAYTALAPLVFLGMFLFTSETARVVSLPEPQAVQAGVGNPAPVVMVVLDELPLAAVMTSGGEIDAELYPNLAELAGDSHWFRNTTSVSSSTWYAVPSIVTGRYPSSGTAPVAADHPRSLFTLLGEGYGMRVTESVTRLCPATVCTDTPAVTADGSSLLRDAVDVMRSRLSYAGPQGDPVAGMVESPAVDESAAPPDAAEEDSFEDFHLDQPARFRALVDGLEGGATLNYLHILLPHVPYRYLPSGVQYPTPDPDPGKVEDDWVDEPWLTALGRQRLQLQVAYVDRLVGELVDELRARDLYDESLVVLTSDHGISFRPGGPVRAIEGQPLEDGDVGELAWVPLFVKEPGQREGTVSDADVRTVDVLPTIADVLDVDLPWEVDGRSALGRPRTGDTKAFHGSDAHAFGIEATGAVQIDTESGWRDVLDSGTDVVLPAVGDPDRFWRTGPRPSLVGREVREIDDVALRRVDVDLDDAGAFDQVDVSSGRVPALVAGTVDGDRGRIDLAIAVNGVVAATAPGYVSDGRVRFAAMVGDDRFRPGANTVEVFAVG